MRWLLGGLCVLAVVLAGAFFWAKGYPYRKYSGWVQGQNWDHFYAIQNFKPLYLNPVELTEIPNYQEDYVQLWKEFPIRNSLIPLPTRHPLFLTVPMVEAKDKNTTDNLGMMIYSSTGRELSRVYTLPTGLYPDHSQGQELFKLPFVKNKILKRPLDTVWADIFSLKIENKNKSLDEMIYDLYIIHLRSKLLPKDTVKYGLIKDGKQAMIELNSPNKDYFVELIMTQNNGTVYSYLLRTEKINPDSIKLRAKFLSSISFSPVDKAMGRLLYTEFKQLNFARQVDQEGMIYLFSAWTQDMDSVELLKEMIFYLERGQNNKQQLKELYNYAFARYGKTFTNRLGTDQDDPGLQLQQKIELEQAKLRLEAEKARAQPLPDPVLSPDEKMNLYLKRAKEDKIKNKKEMTIH